MTAARLVPVASAPEHDAQASVMFTEGWPEFIFHDAPTEALMERKSRYFADLDFYLVDGAELVGGCWAVPVRWDGTTPGLPAGYTDAMARAIDQHEADVAPDTLVVMAAAVRSDRQGRGLAGVALTGLRAVAAERGLAKVIAPVRPTLKSRYPLIPIEVFASWTRQDGQPLDPWLRTHARLGATIVAPAPRSQTITGTVAEWESWTGLDLPSPGRYVIPGGLDVLEVGDDGIGTYTEPNVWMRHA